MAKPTNVVHAYIGVSGVNTAARMSEVHLLTVQQLEEIAVSKPLAKVWIVYVKPEGASCFFTTCDLKPWQDSYFNYVGGKPNGLYQPEPPYTYVGILHDENYYKNHPSRGYDNIKCVCDTCAGVFTNAIPKTGITRFSLIELVDDNE